ncbi:hypothetical protein BS50DRAFT_637832 [Corynespora cassiicola Philippines]|uniref:Uncharacterized protein n=1 Tax=Corynespora cassiicola Philippines TaxID=1448308 RepID=A0A2T2NDM1_CORCC|nr:hypothetical protein BS50DRAFT_637832 [Corynespora cassiicola Philippines]
MLKANSIVYKNGLKIPNKYVWWLTFGNHDKIVIVDTFIDTDLVTKAIEQNPL